MKKLKIIEQLPEELNVKISRNPKTGIWIASIKNLDVFTEADDLMGLIYNVNDLVYAFFDIPKKLQHKVWYKPPFIQEPVAQQQKNQLEELIKFNIYLSPKLHHEYFH